MRSTLLYDIVRDLWSAARDETVRTLGADQPLNAVHPSGAGTEPLHFRHLLYNPTDDPYYVTNLDDDVLPLIAGALEGVKFTHIVQIVLESVRADSYPFQENGLLHQFIQKNIQPAENATPITTQNVTPFIYSVSEHMLHWDQVWSLCPLTNKALLGCTSLLH